jgi:hypothetical protein
MVSSGFEVRMFAFLASFFGNPIMLAGAAAGSIPIIIHLLNRQRFKKIAWGAMHWLWASYKKSQRRLQIEQLILLLLRILLLILLAIALARPALQEGLGLIAGASSVHRVVVIDNSYSMGQQVGGSTLFQKAKDKAVELIDKLGPADVIDVLFVNTQTEELTLKSTSSKADVVNVINLIKAAPLSDGGSDMPHAIAEGCRMLNTRLNDVARKEIIVITDRTRNGWEQNAQPRRVSGDDEIAIKTTFSSVKSRPKIMVMRVAGEQTVDNTVALKLEVDEKIIPVQVETQFVGTVLSYSDSAKPIRIKFKVDGEDVAAETLQTMKKGKSETVSFRYTFATAGTHFIALEIDSDGLNADNTSYLAVEVEDQMRVLCVDGEQRTEANMSETDFLRQAISPTSAEEVNAGKMPLQPEVISDSRFIEESLDPYRLVILCNVSTLPPAKVLALEQFVKNGGAVWIFVGGRVDAMLYNRDLVTLLPHLLGDIVGGDDPNGVREKLSDKEVSHPVVERMRGNKFMSLSHLEVWKRFKLQVPVPPDPAVRTMITYENGDIAAAERQIGSNGGRVLLFGTTADMAWNDWPRKHLYMPLINYVALELVQPAYLQRNRLYGEVFSIQIPHQEIGVARKEGVRLTDPLGEISTMDVITEQSRLESGKIKRAGIYTAQIPGEKPRTLYFAANRNTEESNLEAIEDKEILAMIPKVGETEGEHLGYFKSSLSQADIEIAGDNVSEIEERLKTQTSSREIWRWLAGSVLVLLFIESFLARRFGDFSRK